jgi:hypothetical protein
MEWTLLALLVLAAAGYAAVSWHHSEIRWAGKTWRGLRSKDGRKPPPPRCLRCHGSGRLGRDPERTMNFFGGTFEDRHTPPTRCPACAGTGTAP